MNKRNKSPPKSPKQPYIYDWTSGDEKVRQKEEERFDREMKRFDASISRMLHKKLETATKQFDTGLARVNHAALRKEEKLFSSIARAHRATLKKLKQPKSTKPSPR
jgi:hypothetical protein